MLEQLRVMQGRESQHVAQVSPLQSENHRLSEPLSEAQRRIEELEQLKTPPPAFVKANKKKPQAEQKQARNKRVARHNRARPRSMPTRLVEHRLVTCLTCHLRLGGLSLARCREIIDIPPPAAIEVTEHRIFKGWCVGCQQWHEQVVGQGRIGVCPV
ncbi:MAG: hypothetical protein ACYDER_13780 [Ktedonobacteraceae bacterium]